MDVKNIGNKNIGFSLLDLLLVIMIIGVFGMIAIPQFHSIVSETKLNEAAGEMVSALQYTRNLAVRYQRPFGLKASTASNGFSVFDNQYKTDPNPHHDADPPVTAKGVIFHPLEKKWYEKDFDDLEHYDGVKITSVPAGNNILFYPDGHSSETDSNFILSFAGDSRNIMVNGSTGRVSVQ